MLYLALGRKDQSFLQMLKDFIQGETDSDFFLTYVRAKCYDTLSSLMIQTHGCSPDVYKRVMSLLSDKKETKPQLKINKAFERFSETLLNLGRSDPQPAVSKLLSKIADQALLSLAKHPSLE